MIGIWLIVSTGVLQPCDSNFFKQSLASYEVMQTVPLSTLSDEKPARPPFSAGKFACEVLAGVGVGISSAAVVFFGLNFAISGKYTIYYERGESSWVDMIPVFLGLGAYMFGSAVGVYWVGDTETETGSFDATMLGSIYSTMPFFVCPVGAAIGFNLTRKYKTNGSSSIDFNDGKLSMELVKVRF